jgi:hypothetical protein
MIGSLPLLWPWQEVATVFEPDRKIYRSIWPDSIDSRFWTYGTVIVVSIGAVILVEKMASRLETPRFKNNQPESGSTVE